MAKLSDTSYFSMWWCSIALHKISTVKLLFKLSLPWGMIVQTLDHKEYFWFSGKILFELGSSQRKDSCSFTHFLINPVCPEPAGYYVSMPHLKSSTQKATCRTVKLSVPTDDLPHPCPLTYIYTHTEPRYIYWQEGPAFWNAWLHRQILGWCKTVKVPPISVGDRSL